MRLVSCLLLAAAACNALDIIGYYGNSGNAVSSIPTFEKIHPNYNVVIITFLSIDAKGQVALDIQGPYENNLDGLAAGIAAWKKIPDPFSRTKSVLVSIGGQNGRWPAGVDGTTILNSLTTFMHNLGLDGLDIDLEGSDVSNANSLIPVVTSLIGSGKFVTAAPEASQGPLDAYKPLLSHLSWVHPQFYNNGPNSVTNPYLPSPDLWPTPWTVTDWQDEKNGTAFWAGVLGAIGTADGLTHAQLGMLISCTPAAAGSYNH